MKLSKGHIRERTHKNGETVWVVSFGYKGKQCYRTFYEEMEARECQTELRDAAERGDPSVAARLAAEYEQKEFERKKGIAERKEREKERKQQNFRAPLEFTHKLVLPMSVSHEKMAELVKRLGNADRSQVICATRHITKPPHRVLLLGLRVPRLGSNYVFSVVRGQLGYDITAEIMRIGERPRVRQPQPTSTPKEEEEVPTLSTTNSMVLCEKLHALFAKKERRIRAWHAQGLAVREIIARLFPNQSETMQSYRVKAMKKHFSHSLYFYKGRSPMRVKILKRWEDIKRWEEERHSAYWIGKQLGGDAATYHYALKAIKENQAANARLQSATHSDE